VLPAAVIVPVPVLLPLGSGIDRSAAGAVERGMQRPRCVGVPGTVSPFDTVLVSLSLVAEAVYGETCTARRAARGGGAAPAPSSVVVRAARARRAAAPSSPRSPSGSTW